MTYDCACCAALGAGSLDRKFMMLAGLKSPSMGNCKGPLPLDKCKTAHKMNNIKMHDFIVTSMSQRTPKSNGH